MGVYIKDMEMPKEGSWVTLRVFPDGQCVLHSWCGNDFDFMEHLTAIPVSPHGRLVDADAVSLDGGPYEYDEWCKWALDQYQDAPTIIEAEQKGENNGNGWKQVKISKLIPLNVEKEELPENFRKE